MKKIFLSVAFAITFVFTSFIAFGVHSTYQMDMNDMPSAANSNPCAFMGEVLLCSMSPLEHMQYFRNFVLGNFPQMPLMSKMSFALAICVFYLWYWIHLVQFIPKQRYKKFSSSSINPILRIFTKINQRLYA